MPSELTLSKKTKLLAILGIAITGVLSAITYTLFENGVHLAIDNVWYDWLNTDSNRYLVIPACLVIGLMFFGLQHFLDRESEDKLEHGLGNAPTPSIKNYLKILLIGLLSLLAGASLGREAILVPACMIVGGFVASKMLGNNQQLVKLMSAAGIMALFTAFFSSFVIGFLSVFLVIKQAKVKLSPILVLTAVLASACSFVTLKLVSSDSYAQLPSYDYKLNLEEIIVWLILFVGGFLVVMVMDMCYKFLVKIRSNKILKNNWVIRSLLASVTLGVLFVIGGPLVEFTGNRSIVPMFDQASSLGLAGLLGILLVKVLVISWSKAIGYRGGMIFPTIFVASVMIAIAQLYIRDVNYIYGLIFAIAGALVANKKTHVLV